MPMERKNWNEFLDKNQISTGKQLKVLNNRLPSGSKEAKDTSYLENLNWGESNDNYRMDKDKLSWHTDRVKEWIKGEPIIPLHIDMGISTGCNLACHFCYGVVQGREGFQARGGKMQLMPLKVIQSVFSDAKTAGVRSIALVGEAENTLNPDLYPAIEFARDINLDVSLATHGANFQEKHIESLMTSLQWIRINISAATRESYINVHQRPWLDRVLSGTELLVSGHKEKQYRNRANLPTTVGYQMVLTDRNFDQIIPMAKLGREMGVDYLVIKACSDTPDGRIGTPHEQYLELRDVFKEAENFSTEEYDVIVRWNKLGNKGNKSYSTCDGTRFIVALSGDGTLFPCGHWFAIERDKYAMGNVFSDPLSKIFESERYWEVQRQIHCLDLRNCETNCRQHAVNLRLDEIRNNENPLDYIDSLESSEGEYIQHKNFI